MSTKDITNERKDGIIKELITELMEGSDPEYWNDTLTEILTEDELEAYGFGI